MIIELLETVKNSEKPIKRGELANTLKISEREVRSIISELNNQGFAIISTGKGFIYTEDNSKIERWARTLKKSAITQIKRAAALQKITAKKLGEQLILEL